MRILNTFFSKVLTFLIYLRYPSIPSQYRFFIRYYYIGLIYQLKFFVKDYVIRARYKIISYNSEFSPELKFVLPHAYWHYKNGTLKETIASKDTKELYFFSPKHREFYDKREWVDFNYDLDIPNSVDHNLKYDYSKWERVPLKEHYQNNIFIFDKPILIIANKYNREWMGNPVNYLSLEIIEFIYDNFAGKYQIIYNRPESGKIVDDESEIMEFEDKKHVKEKLEKIILMDDLYNYSLDRVNNFNHFQLMVYANTENFISVHGGTATLASYFGGINMIYSVRGHETFFREYQTIYPKLSGAKILHVESESSLRDNLIKYF